MREASFLYAELVTMGAPMGFCDVGGGLAVDYEVCARMHVAANNMTHSRRRPCLPHPIGI